MYVCMLWSVDSLPDNEVFGLEMLYPVSLPFAFSILRLLKGLQFVGLFVLLCFFFFPPGIYVCMLWMGIGYQMMRFLDYRYLHPVS